VDASVEVATVVLGGPAKGIVEIADAAGADLIAAGTRGHSTIAGLVVGSVREAPRVGGSVKRL
jgi:nucleotide-binding universal stress UspA family protein